MENLRHGDTRTLRVVWDVVDDEDGRREEEVFLPWPPEFPATTADPMGDGVAETLMLRDFAIAVRHRTAPDQDVYFGVELSITGIQAMDLQQPVGRQRCRRAGACAAHQR
jgi:hypothetical protein